MKYCVCLYDRDGKLIGKTIWSCFGCAKKRAAKLAPCCIRNGNPSGNILWKNELYKKYIEGE